MTLDQALTVVKDLKIAPISMEGQCLIQWNFNERGFPGNSLQVPIKFAEAILVWRSYAEKCASFLK